MWWYHRRLAGVVIGQEVARALPRAERSVGWWRSRDVRRARCQRHVDACAAGLACKPDQHVLVVEDVWTTGGSTEETIHVVQEAGGRVVAAGALIDRSGGTIEFPVESNALTRVED